MAENRRKILLVERHAERAEKYAQLLSAAADVQIVPSLLDKEPGSPVDDDVITVVNAILQTHPEACDIGMVLVASPLYNMDKLEDIQRVAGQVSPTPELIVIPLFEHDRHVIARLNQAGGKVIGEIRDADFETDHGPEAFYSAIMYLLYAQVEDPEKNQPNP